jgi:hypothetical protein
LLAEFSPATWPLACVITESSQVPKPSFRKRFDKPDTTSIKRRDRFADRESVHLDESSVSQLFTADCALGGEAKFQAVCQAGGQEVLSV